MLRMVRSFSRAIGKTDGSIPVYNRLGNTYSFLKEQWLSKGDLMQTTDILPSVIDHKQVFSYYKDKKTTLKEVLTCS